MSRWVMIVPFNLRNSKETWTFLGDVQKLGSSMDAMVLNNNNALSVLAREAAPANATSFLRGDLLLCFRRCGRSRRGLIETTNNNQLQKGVLHHSPLVLQQPFRMKKSVASPRLKKNKNFDAVDDGGNRVNRSEL